MIFERTLKHDFIFYKKKTTMEIAEQIVELKQLGYICIQPLRKLTYANGVTYNFKTGQYFTCHKENDTEWKSTIFNSKLKKLGRTGTDTVCLKIKGATATLSSCTEPSTWCVDTAKSDTVNMYKFLNTIRVRAVLDAAESGIIITEYCGVVPVFKYAVPSSEVSHYAIETKKMRDMLLAANETEIKLLPEKWLSLLYITGGSGRRSNRLTAAQRKVILDNYEIYNIDGAIRHKETKRIVENVVPILSATVNDKPIQMHVYRHRAYMSTFKSHEKREHQGEIDHIDGDDSNNVPWNYRWVSSAENELVKHSERARRVVPDMDALIATHGPPSDPKEWKGWTFHSNMLIMYPDKSQPFVALAEPGKYPRIGVTLKDAENNTMKPRKIQCHSIVAYVFRAHIPISEGTLKYLASVGKSASYFETSPMTYFEFTKELKKGGLVIKHTDDDKSNYNLNNLEIGTPSENQEARHKNPATTRRKRVNIFDVGSITEDPFMTFGSHADAATYLGVSRITISAAVVFNRTRKITTYVKTTSKRTRVKYHIVDAI